MRVTGQSSPVNPLPFGRHALVAHYEAMIRGFLSNLTPDSYDGAVAAASAPELVRGYEDVKMRNVQLYIKRLDELGVDTSTLSTRGSSQAAE